MNDHHPSLTRAQLTLLALVLLLGTVLLTITVARTTSALPLVGPSAAEGGAWESAREKVEAADLLPNCRYGVSINNVNQVSYMDSLHLGWFITFNVSPNWPAPEGVENVLMVRMKQDKNGLIRLPSYTLTTQPLTDEPGGLGPIVAAHPGRVWIVGNEVDRFFWQDDVEPSIYALAYRDVYHFIKERDPSAQIATSGLVQVTPNRIDYLNLVWESYLEQFGTPMPVDIWTMHIYVLPEARIDGNGQIVGSNAAIAVGTPCSLNPVPQNCENIRWEGNGLGVSCSPNNVYCIAEHDSIAIFNEQVVRMRQWMANHGQQNKPLFLTEYSLLYPYVPEGNGCFIQDEYGRCFDPARVNTFMDATFNYLETAVDTNLGYPLDNHRLVQKWLWYTMAVANDEDAGSSSRLLALDGSGNPTGFTAVGQNFQSEVSARAQSVNLFLQNVQPASVLSGTTTTELAVKIMNNGNVANSNDYTVTFYRDSNLTDVIDSVTVSAPLFGCAIHQDSATITWDGLVPGVNNYWVELSSSEDSNAADNVTSGLVLVGGERKYMPLLFDWGN